MSKYKKTPIPDDLRQAVFKRDNYTCRYCGTTKGPFHCDHVYPEKHGGKAVAGNMVTACRKCNLRKRDKVGVWPPTEDELNYLRTARKIISRQESTIKRNRGEIDDRERKLMDIVENQKKDSSTRENVKLGTQLYLLVVSAVSFPGVMYGIAHDLTIWLVFILMLWIPIVCIIFLKIYAKVMDRALSKSR